MALGEALDFCAPEFVISKLEARGVITSNGNVGESEQCQYFWSSFCLILKYQYKYILFLKIWNSQNERKISEINIFKIYLVIESLKQNRNLVEIYFKHFVLINYWQIKCLKITTM